MRQNESYREKMKALNLAQDKEYKIVLRLALPAMLAQLINVLYSIVDRLYISSIDQGAYALAGIGIVAPICTLITSFSYWIGVGGAPFMSRSLGEKNQNKAEAILANSFLALVVVSLLIPLFVLLLYPILLPSFGASENTYDFARDYLLIYLLGAPFAILSLGLNQFIISLGYSTKGMMTMLIGAVINIILDPILIFSCHMGVMGAALATTLSQVCSFLFTIFVLFSKNSQVRITFKGYSFKILRSILLLGLSPFVIAATDSIVCIVLNTSIKLYALEAVDEYIMVATITNSFFQLITMPLLGISGGTGAILSFNYGARNMRRVKNGERFILGLALIFTSLSFLLSFFIVNPFLSLFTQDATIASLTRETIRIFMYGIVVLSFQYCFVDGLTALGKAKAAVILSLIRKSLIIGLTLILPLWLQVNGCFYAELVSDVVSSIITLLAFTILFRRMLQKNSMQFLHNQP